ncbi:MAG: SCP2 sterol-binding domain-containing protein [Actinobacteria bacterium]|nr:SCP2 sterol-binding domain-containing protein [Actinomycetota bacterium]
MATAFPFLSPDWMNAARTLRETLPRPDTAPPVAVRMNLVVTDTPFDADVQGHVDTTDGEVIIEDGHLDGPDLTVTVDYETARAIFIDQDAAAAMQAFMGGRIKVDGDLTKMLAMQASAAAPDANAQALADALRDITAD